MPAEAPERLRRWEKLVLAISILLVVAFAALVEIRSCFLNHRHTDYGVYARAAWAARTGGDIYAIADEHGWHYCYPPPFALALTPLADPPQGESREGYVPFWFSVAIWLLISLFATGWTVHILAKAILPDAVPWSRRWVYSRTIPITVSLGAIGYTLSHGQVNTVVAAMMASAFVAFVMGRRAGMGVWLAAAAAMKATPGLLLLFPFIRRDGRALAAFIAASLGFLVLFPAAFFGFGGAIASNRSMVEQVLAPGATGSGDQTRAEELTLTLATDSSSFQAVIHTWRNPGPRWFRPHDADRTTRLAHWGASGCMLAITLYVLWRKRSAAAADQLVIFGSLILVMVLMSPVSHTHHFAMALPAVCGLWLKGLMARPGGVHAGWRTNLILAIWGVGIVLILIPGEFGWTLREFGVGTAVTLIFWGYGLVGVWRSRTVAHDADFVPTQGAASSPKLSLTQTLRPLSGRGPAR